MKTHSWKGYLYLLESNGLYKIGYSTEPETRLRRLQTGSACPIKIVHTIRTGIYREIERQLHARFWRKRLHGEWFVLDDTDVAYIKELDHLGVSKVARDRNAATKLTLEQQGAALARLEAMLNSALLGV